MGGKVCSKSYDVAIIYDTIQYDTIRYDTIGIHRPHSTAIVRIRIRIIHKKRKGSLNC